MDVVAIDKAVEADCIITEGFNLKPAALKSIEQAYKMETGAIGPKIEAEIAKYPHYEE